MYKFPCPVQKQPGQKPGCSVIFCESLQGVALCTKCVDQVAQDRRIGRRHRVQQENLAAVGVCLQPFQRLCRFGLCIGFPVHIGIAPEQGAVAAFLCRLQRCLGVFPAGTPEILHFIAVIVQHILVQIQNLCLCLGFGQRGQAGVGHARGCPGRVPPQSCGSQGQFPFWRSRR